MASVIKCRVDFECLPFCLPLFITRSELDSDVYCGAVGSLDGFNGYDVDRNLERLSPRKQRRVFVRLKPSYDQAIQHIVIRIEFLFAPDINFDIAFVRHRSISTKIP